MMSNFDWICLGAWNQIGRLVQEIQPCCRQSIGFTHVIFRKEFLTKFRTFCYCFDFGPTADCDVMSVNLHVSQQSENSVTVAIKIFRMKSWNLLFKSPKYSSIAKQILELLDYDSILACRAVSSVWKKYIDKNGPKGRQKFERVRRLFSLMKTYSLIDSIQNAWIQIKDRQRTKNVALLIALTSYNQRKVSPFQLVPRRLQWSLIRLDDTKKLKLPKSLFLKPGNVQ